MACPAEFAVSEHLLGQQQLSTTHAPIEEAHQHHAGESERISAHQGYGYGLAKLRRLKKQQRTQQQQQRSQLSVQVEPAELERPGAVSERFPLIHTPSFNTGHLPLNHSGNPGVRWPRISQE